MTMKEYCVTWCQCPHAHHTNRILFVEAASADDAKAIAKDHVQRTYGITWFSVFNAFEPTPPPPGRVKA